MDPFRDELAAAHAKIAQLEEQIRQLHAKPPTRGNGVVFVLLGLVTLFLFLIGMGAALVMTRAPR
jgi:hypothetical protein